MLKVAIVSITRTHMLNLAIALQDRPDIDVVFYTLTPKSRLRQFGYYGRVVSFVFPLGIIFFLIHKIHFSFERHLTLGHRLRNLFDKTCSLFIRPCDILIGENGDAYRTSIVSKKKYGSIIICDQGSSHITAQDEYFKEMGVYTNPWNTQNLLNHYSVSDYMMVPSEYVKMTDIKGGIDERKILYNPYGVDTDVFRVTNKPEDGAYDVLFVGNWCLRKGCDMLIKACKQLNLKLLHVGGISDCPFPSEPNFTHIGLVQEKELPEFYSKAKIFVLPSKNEGLALVTLQATAAGLPLVSSRNAGGIDIQKLIGGNSSCFIIDEPLSVETIKAAIVKAMDCAEKLPEGPRNQNGDGINNITWKAYGDRYYKILKDIASKR